MVSFIFHTKISGSLWRESKLALARSYATATQASMHSGTGVELRTNPKHSFSPQIPFYSTLTVSPSMQSNINNNLRSMNTEQIPGTFRCTNHCCCCCTYPCALFSVVRIFKKKAIKKMN